MIAHLAGKRVREGIDSRHPPAVVMSKQLVDKPQWFIWHNSKTGKRKAVRMTPVSGPIYYETDQTTFVPTLWWKHLEGWRFQGVRLVRGLPSVPGYILKHPFWGALIAGLVVAYVVWRMKWA